MVCIHISWFEEERFLKMSNRFIKLLLLLKGNPEVIICLGIVRVYPYGFPVRLDRFLKLEIIMQTPSLFFWLTVPCPVASGQ